jgi:hypothetical protein
MSDNKEGAKEPSTGGEVPLVTTPEDVKHDHLMLIFVATETTLEGVALYKVGGTVGDDTMILRRENEPFKCCDKRPNAAETFHVPLMFSRNGNRMLRLSGCRK